MKVTYISNNNKDSFIETAESCVMAIGFFDGMHYGHQKVLQVAREIAEEHKLPLACMSFFPHPNEVIRNKTEFPYLMPLTQKEKILRQIGVDIFYIIDFCLDFASLPPKDFVTNYLLGLRAEFVIAGFDFTYGLKGKGNMDRLEDDANGLLKAIKVEKVEYNGEKISSTLIRKLIYSGNMKVLPLYLGSHYQIKGTLKHCLPTAEVDIEPHYLLPRCGTYKVIISNGKEHWPSKATVVYGNVRLFLSQEMLHTLNYYDHIKIVWLERESIELLTHLEQSV